MNLQRRSLRLQGYDYAQSGAYFVTICTHQRLPLFGQVVDGEMVFGAWGRIVQSCWDQIPMHYPMVELDAFVVMPNHVHGVIVITNDGDNSVGATHGSPVHRSPVHGSLANGAPIHKPFAQGAQRNSLGAVIGQFKSSVTRRVHQLPNPPDHPIWLRNYYDHIIRNEKDLNRIREYVLNNPARWHADRFFA